MGETVLVQRAATPVHRPSDKTGHGSDGAAQQRALPHVNESGDPKTPGLDRALILLSRTVATGLLLSLVAYQRQLDAALAAAWPWLREQWWFKHDSFEPVLSSACFQIYLLLWRGIDMTLVLGRWRIQKRSEETPWLDAWQRATNEGFWYLAPLLVVDWFFPRRQLTLEAPTAVAVVCQVALTISIYDVLFFFGHSLFHSTPYLYKTFHSLHHKHSSVRACEAIRHNIADGTYDVVCSIVALRLVGSHPLARALHNITLIWLLTELHAGYDLPWQLHNIVPFGIIGGTPRHDHHHHYGAYYHQKFFTVLDKVFGHEPPPHKACVSLAEKVL